MLGHPYPFGATLLFLIHPRKSRCLTGDSVPSGLFSSELDLFRIELCVTKCKLGVHVRALVRFEIFELGGLEAGRDFRPLLS